MMPLNFIIEGQLIKKDPSSPFHRMVAGTVNYYCATFSLDATWNGYACVACFRTGENKQYVPIVKGRATIPNEIMKYKEIYVSVIGKKGDTKLVTNETIIFQSGGIVNG